MAEIKWEAIKAPDTGDYLKYLAYAQLQQQDAIKGLMETAKGVQTSIRDKNNAQLLDLLNQQKSTNDLSGDTFQQAWKQQVNNFNGEYDANKAAEAQRAMFDTLQNRQAKAQDMDIQNQTNIRANDKFNMEKEDRTRLLNAQKIYDITSIPLEQRTPEQVATLNSISNNYDAKELLGLHSGQASLNQTRAITEGKLKENKWIDATAQAGINQTNASAAASLANAAYNQAQTDAQKNENKITGYSIDQLEANNPQLSNPAAYKSHVNNIVGSLGRVDDWFKSQGQDANTFFNDVGQQYGIEPALLKAILVTESSGKVAVRSGKGAIGFMQVLPSTAKRFGFDANNPLQNITASAAYLKFLKDKYNGNMDKVIAAYNTGEGNVDKHWGTDGTGKGGGVMTKAWDGGKGTTLNYVNNVKARMGIIASGNLGKEINWGNGLYVNGKMVGETNTTGTGSTAIGNAFKQSPAGIKSSLLTDLSKIDQEVLTANANTGSGTYKNPTQFLKEKSPFGVANITAQNLYDAALGKNLKFDNTKLKEQYKSINVDGFKLLNDAQQAGVLERAYDKLYQRSGGSQVFMGMRVTDQDAVDMRKFVADEVNLLLSPKSQQITNKRDARIIEAVSEYTARHGVTGYDAAKDLGVDEQTMKRIGIEIPKPPTVTPITPTVQQVATASANLNTSANKATVKNPNTPSTKKVITSSSPLVFNNHIQRRPTVQESMKMFGF